MDLMTAIPLGFIIFIVVATIGLGIWATRKSKTASDFFVASRSVGVGMNASAISGEYLSAASFLGVAGLIMKFGYDPLWYPVCYAAGYLLLLLFIAGPLRRFGAYTIPDFAEGRFDSPMFRKIAVTFVLFIGFFYTMPQMKGAGITMSEIMGWEYWVGIVAVGVVITFNVALGGMKGITFVQAFQYWAKMFAISIPVFVLMTVYGWYGDRLGETSDSANPGGTPALLEDKVLQMPGADKAPANALVFSVGETVLSFPKGATIKPVPVLQEHVRGDTGTVHLEQRIVPEPANGIIAPGSVITVHNFAVPTNAVPSAALNPTAASVGKPLRIEFLEPAEVHIAAGQPTPSAPPNKTWIQPFGAFTSKHGYPLLYTYSLIMALVCGTAGLPHILVRFYTNPDGRAAKRTTFWVMVLIGVFYIFTPIWGTLGRWGTPELYASGRTDAVVIALPKSIDNGLLGAILSGITSAGAFAAFMSTFSGLLVSMSGAVAHDIYGRIFRPNASPRSRLVAFKVAAVLIGIISMYLGLQVQTFDITVLVGWAFAIGAASYFPLLLMGSWWRGLTIYGAASGMLLGGLLSLSAIVTTMLIDRKVITLKVDPLTRTLMEQPAIWGVPLAIIVMIVISKMTPRSVPHDVDIKMLRLHAPEEMGLSKNYIEN